ncbi:MAG: hypothetical protein ACFFDP_06605 [Promethearchaeota archaeon]
METGEESSRVAEIFAIGIGECGSNLVGAYLKQARDRALPHRVRGYLCMNTDRSDIQKLRQKYNVPKENTLLYGASDIGCGGNFHDGYSFVHEFKDVILGQLTQLGYEGVSGFVIFTSTGGGTGCGGAPALIEILKERFQEEEGRRIFVYVMGVLPFKDQTSEAVNTMWALSKLLRGQLEERGADLVCLLSNRAMLRRILAWQEGEVADFLQRQLGIDLGKVSDVESVVSSTVDGADAVTKAQESAFVELVNPLALRFVEQMLSPGVVEPGKEVFPTTDIADYARKLDPIVVPCLYTDVSLIPSGGNIPTQIRSMVKYAIEHCSFAEIGTQPAASSVYYTFSGYREFARAEYDPHIKEALRPYIAKGAAVTPCFVSYEDEGVPSDLVVLLGLPQIPEVDDLVTAAKELVDLHSGSSPLRRGWFKKSKGVTEEELRSAINDVAELFALESK